MPKRGIYRIIHTSKSSINHHMPLFNQGDRTMSHQEVKLLDQVRNTLRRKHYSYETEKQYVYWIRKYILFHIKKHPREMGQKEVEAFLTPVFNRDKISFNLAEMVMIGKLIAP